MVFTRVCYEKVNGKDGCCELRYEIVLINFHDRRCWSSLLKKMKILKAIRILNKIFLLGNKYV